MVVNFSLLSIFYSFLFFYLFIFFSFAIVEERHAFIAKQCLRLSDGIKKIDDASVQIDVLRVQVEEQRKNVLIAATKCEKMLQGIEQCMLPIFPSSTFSFTHLYFCYNLF